MEEGESWRDERRRGEGSSQHDRVKGTGCREKRPLLLKKVVAAEAAVARYLILEGQRRLHGH